MDNNDAKTLRLSDILDNGLKYPTTSVTIYTDRQAWAELSSLETLAFTGTDEERNKIHERQVELVKTVRESAVVFHLKALPNSLGNAIYRKAIAEKSDRNDAVEAASREIISRSVYKIETAAGDAVDFDGWEDTHKFLDMLPPEDYRDISDAYEKLSLESMRNTEILTDPSFS